MIGDSLIINNSVQIIILESGTAEGQFAFKVTDGYLYAASTSSNQLKTQDSIKNNGSWTITISEGIATVKANQSNRNWLRFNLNNGSPIFSCYASGQIDISIYKACYIICNHSYDSEIIEPTCLNKGYTKHVCSKCGDSYQDNEEDALGHDLTQYEKLEPTCENSGYEAYEVCSRCDYTTYEELSPRHNYVDGKCTACGQEENTSSPVTATLNIFGSNGTMSSDNNSISWTTDNVTVINTKGSTAIRTSDSDHFRVYANSKVDISVDEGLISKIVFTIPESKYVDPMVTSINQVDGCNATSSGNTVTVTVNNLQTITFTASAQTRITKVEVTYK